MKIRSLADHQELVPTIARWHYGEWGHYDPDGSIESWTTSLRNRALRNQIPTVFIALEGEEPLGSAALVEFDMDTRKDLSPWIAGLYVLPAHRRKGIGSALILHAMHAARRLGVPTLYLYTRGSESFYQQLGWREVNRELFQGREVTIMDTDLRKLAHRVS